MKGMTCMDNYWYLGGSAGQRDDAVKALNDFLRGHNVVCTIVNTKDSMSRTVCTYLGPQPVLVVEADGRNMGRILVPLMNEAFYIPVTQVVVGNVKHMGVISIDGRFLTIAHPLLFFTKSKRADTQHYAITRISQRS